MSTAASNSYSVLYRRIRLARNTIPPLASIGVLIFEWFEHGTLFRPMHWTPLVDILVFGLVGPGLTFLVLNWLLHRVKERDEAEARLAIVSAHERELLSQLERSVRAEGFGLVPTLESILAAIGTETSMTRASLYPLSPSDGKLLPATVSWPGPEAGLQLTEAGQRALLQARAGSNGPEAALDVTGGGSDERTLAVPITDHGDTLGLLVLSGPATSAPPNPGVLGVIAGALALLIRNTQLYSRLQSQAVMDERNELARDVHDGLAQSLGFLNFKAQQVKRLLERGDRDGATVAVNELCDGSKEVYEEVRVLIRNLRSSVGVTGGLVSNIRQYSAMLTKRTGLEIIVDAPAELSLASEAQLQLFRVVQEALTNAHKHAIARHVVIRLGEGPDCVHLTVEDDGLGLPAVQGDPGRPEEGSGSSAPRGVPGSDEHLGLRIMRERVQSIGGELEVESWPDRGTTVRIRVPAGCGDDMEEAPSDS